MLSNAYFLAKFRFDTAENEPAKNLQNFAKFANFADPNPLTDRAVQPMVVPHARVVFAGLGNMGYPMAACLARAVPAPLVVWNRAHEKALKHAAEHGTVAQPTDELTGSQQS